MIANIKITENPAEIWISATDTTKVIESIDITVKVQFSEKVYRPDDVRLPFKVEEIAIKLAHVVGEYFERHSFAESEDHHYKTKSAQ